MVLGSGPVPGPGSGNGSGHAFLIQDLLLHVVLHYVLLQILQDAGRGQARKVLYKLPVGVISGEVGVIRMWTPSSTW